MTVLTFKNRTEAGKLLAERLMALSIDSPRIVALPRGGILVAHEIAQKLKAPLDTLVVKKINTENNPELDIGAVGPEETIIIEKYAQDSFDISPKEMEDLVLQAKKQREELVHIYKKFSYTLQTSSKNIILVDDGLASSVIAQTAIESAKKVYHTENVFYASPICSRDSIMVIKKLVHTLSCLSEPDDLISLGLWYDEFDPVDDEHVRLILEKANQDYLHRVTK
jgi:putative phosphoribosyl transferase